MRCSCGDWATAWLLPPFWRGICICLVSAALGILVNALSPKGLPLFGPVPDLGDKRLEAIDLQEAWTLFQGKKAVFVDARSREEYRAGHIPGALWLPGELGEETVSSLLDWIPPDALLVAYCSDEGCGASREVAERLLDAGYSNVKVFAGGWGAWVDAGYPVESSAGDGIGIEGTQ